MILPEAIDDAAAGQRVFGVGQPVGQGSTASGFILGVRQNKATFETLDNGNRAGDGLLARSTDVAALEDVDDFWFRQVCALPSISKVAAAA